MAMLNSQRVYSHNCPIEDYVLQFRGYFDWSDTNHQNFDGDIKGIQWDITNGEQYGKPRCPYLITFYD